MVTARCTFEAGTAGATISTSNSGGGPYNDDAFDVVTIGATSEAVYDSDASKVCHGSLAARVSAAAGEEVVIRYTTKLGTLTEIYGRVELYVPALPTSHMHIIRARKGTTRAFSIALRDNTGKVGLHNTAGALVAESTWSVPIATKFWMEWHVVLGAGTAQAEIRVYPTLDSTTPDTLTASNWDSGADANSFEIGLLARGATSPAAGPIWFDSLAYDSQGWVGPFVRSISVLGVTAGGVGPVELQAAGTQANYRFQSVIDGGGFQNSGDADGTSVLSASDDAGIALSRDGGVTWAMRNSYAREFSDSGVAAVVLCRSAAHAGKAFAAIGNGNSGGALFLRSLDGGRTWERRAEGSAAPNVRAGDNDAYPELPSPHPRSVGRLIAVDETGSSLVLYCISHRDGLYRSLDEGKTWTRISMAPGANPYYGRCVMISPANSNDVLVGTRGTNGGFWLIPNAKTGTNITPQRLGAGQAATPSMVEDAIAIGQRVWCACGTDGIRRWNFNTSTWSDRTGSLTGTEWCAIDASSVSNIIVGCAKPTVSGGVYRSVARTTDEGTTWTFINTSNRYWTIGGPSGPEWWHKGSAIMNIVSQVRIDPADPNRIYVFGRGGIWFTMDNGANWYPSVRGLGVTINHPVLAYGSRAYIGNVDWFTFHTADEWATVVNTRQPSGVGNDGWSIALDTAVSPPVVYVGAGHRSTNTGGEVVYATDPSSGWSSLGLGSALTTAYGQAYRVIGLAVRRISGQPVVIACVEQGGIWRWAGSWTNVAPPSSVFGTRLGSNRSISVVWLGSYVFAYDPYTGIWRSSNNGQTWTRIWAVGTSGLGSVSDFTCYMAGDPTSAGRLYISNTNGLYLLEDARSGTVGSGLTPATLSVARPGAIACDPSGRVYVVSRPSATSVVRLMRSTDGGATWTDIADGTFVHQAPLAIGLSVSGTGSIHVTNRGMGALVGKLSSGAQSLSPSGVAAAGVGPVTLQHLTPPLRSIAPSPVTADGVGPVTLVASVPAELLAYFLPPSSGERLPHPSRIPEAPRSPRWRRFLATEWGGPALEIGGRSYPRGRWNGPLTDAEVTAITAAGYGARIVYVTDPAELPGVVD